MRSYDAFAPYFDAWQRAFGGPYDDLILPRLERALGRFAPEARRVVDLGIGTGDLVIALARRGYDVVGVDVSPAMLAVAREKIAAAGLARLPALLECDIRELRLVPPADVAVCVYTVVNQLTADGDLDRSFGAVRRSLVAGGLFVFEVNLPAAYALLWSGDDEVAASGARIRRRHRTIPERALIEADVTIEAADGAVTRDRIRQRPWSDGEIARALGEAGFAVVAREPFDPFGGEEATKELWLARAGREA